MRTELLAQRGAAQAALAVVQRRVPASPLDRASDPRIMQRRAAARVVAHVRPRLDFGAMLVLLPSNL